MRRLPASCFTQGPIDLSNGRIWPTEAEVSPAYAARRHAGNTNAAPLPPRYLSTCEGAHFLSLSTRTRALT